MCVLSSLGAVLEVLMSLRTHGELHEDAGSCRHPQHPFPFHSFQTALISIPGKSSP
jgi:hypothetical protein